MAWTDEQREAAIRLWRACKSAAFIARTIGRLQGRIAPAMRFFFRRARASRASPKPNVLAPTFRLRAWALADLPGARRAAPKSPHGAIGLSSSARREAHESESRYRSSIIAKRPEKSGRMTRPPDGEGPMSLRVAIRACRRAQALRAEAGQTVQRFEQGVKSAR